MPGVLEVVKAFYEISTVVTDIVLNNEYIKRGWTEEYALSIAFLVFNGVVMAIVGLQLEAAASTQRYVRWRPLNTLIGGLLGLLQLRVLVETLYSYMASSRADKEMERSDVSSSTDQELPYQQQQQQQQQQPQETALQRATRLEEGLVFVTFVQAMVRDVPVFVIQANATIHYRKWKLVDLWAVVSTGVTLINAVSGYVNAAESKTKATTAAAYPIPTTSTASKALALGATLFLLGQFVFRLGAILLVATTKGFSIVVYGVAITALAIGATISLRLATPMQSTGAQAASALLFFPLFTVFTLDAAFVGPHVGDAKRALFSAKLLLLNAWRVVENAVGILLAVVLPRYTDFGKSTDREIALIGLGCGAVYFLSLLVFVVVVHFAPTATNNVTATFPEPHGEYDAPAMTHAASPSHYVNPDVLPQPESTQTPN